MKVSEEMAEQMMAYARFMGQRETEGTSIVLQMAEFGVKEPNMVSVIGGMFQMLHHAGYEQIPPAVGMAIGAIAMSMLHVLCPEYEIKVEVRDE